MFNKQSKIKTLNELLTTLKINGLNENDYHFYLPLKCKFEEDRYSQFLTCQNDLLFENRRGSQGIINLFLYQKIQQSHNIAVVYGESGSGKSFTAKEIEQFLWKQYDLENEQQVPKLFPILINRLEISSKNTDLIKEILSSQYFFDSSLIDELRQQVELEKIQLALLFDQCKINVNDEILKNCQQFWRDSKIIIMMEDSKDDENLVSPEIDSKKHLKIQILQFQQKQIDQFIELSFQQKIKSFVINYLRSINKNFDKIDMLINIILGMNKQHNESQWKEILLENQPNSLKQAILSNSSISSEEFDYLINAVQKLLSQMLTPIKYLHNIAKYQLEELTKSPKILSILINTLNMMDYQDDQSLYDFYDNFIKNYMIQEFKTIMQRQNQIDEISYVQTQLKIIKTIFLKTVFNYNSSVQVKFENQNNAGIKQSFLTQNFINQSPVQEYLTIKFILECIQNLTQLAESDFSEQQKDLFFKFPEIQILSKIQLYEKSNKNIVDTLRFKLSFNSSFLCMINTIQKSALIENFEQAVGNLFFLLKEIQPIIKNQDFKNIKIKNTNLENAQFIECDFSGSQFANVDISGTEFIGCNLNNVNWQSTITPPINIVVGSRIQSAKFLSNGKFIAIACKKNTVNLFKIKQGKLISNFIFAKYQIKEISIEQNQEIMAISDLNSQVALWSIHRGKIIRKKECNSNASFVLLSKNANFLAYGSEKKTSVKVLNVQTWLIRSIQQNSLSSTFTPNEKELATLTRAYQINSLQLSTKKVILKFDGALFYSYNKICFSPNGKYFLLYYGNHVGIWNWKTQQIVQTIQTSYQYALQFLSDSRSFVQTLSSGFQIYQFEKDQFVQQNKYHEKTLSNLSLDCSSKSQLFILYSKSKQTDNFQIVDKTKMQNNQKTENYEIEPLFKFSSNGNYFAYGGTQLKLFNTNTWSKVELNDQSFGAINHLAISSDGLFLAIALKTQIVQVFSVYDCKVIAQLENLNYLLSQVAFSNDGQTLAIINHNEILFWNFRKNTFLEQSKLEIYKGENGFFLRVNDFFVTCWQNKIIKILNFQNHKQISKFIQHSKTSTLSYCKQSMMLASGTMEKKVKQWNIIKIKLIRQYKSHSGFISTLSFSANGKLLASGSDDKTIVLWNNSLGQNEKVLIGHVQFVLTVQFHQSEEILVSSGGDSMLILWDAKSGQQIKQFQGCNGNVNSIVFSPIEQLLISGGEDKCLCYWDLKQLKQLKRIQSFTKQIQVIAFSQDSQKIAICSVGSLENQISIWNINSKQLIKSQSSQKGSINAMSFSSNDKTLIFEVNEQIIFWEYMIGELNTIQLQTNQNLYEIVFSRDGKLFVTRDNKNQIILWDFQKREQLEQLKVHQSKINSVLFTPDETQLLSSSNNIFVWDVNIYESKQIINGQNNDSRLKILGFLRGGKIFVYNSLKSIDLKIYFCCVKTGECIKSLNKFGSCYIMSPDGNYLIYQNNQKQLISQRIYQERIIEKHQNKELLTKYLKKSILDQDSYKELNFGFQNENEEEAKLKAHFSSLHQVAISSNGNLLASACKDSMVSLWNANNGKFIRNIYQSEQQIRWNIDFSPDCQLLCYYYGRHVYIYDLQALTVRCLFQKYSGSFHYIIFSPKESVIATLYSDLSDFIILWDISTEKPLLSIEGYNTQLRSLAFTFDGNYIVTGSIDSCIYFLDSNSGEQVDQLDGMNYQSDLLVFSFDGKYLLSKEITQKLYFWNVESSQLLNIFDEPKFSITKIFFYTPQGFQILGIEQDELFVFNLQTNQKLINYQNQNEIVQIIKQSREKKIAQISQAFSILVWDIAEGKLIKKIEQPKLHLVFSSSDDKKLIAFQFPENHIQVWDTENQLHLYIFKGHSDKINQMIFSHKNQYLVSGSSDNTVIIWDIANGKIIQQLYGHKSSVCALALSSDNNTFSSGSQDHTIRIHTLDNLSQSKVLEGHQSFVTSLQFSNDGLILASGSYDNYIILWNIKSLESIRILEGHKSEILSLKFSLDGLNLISESYDQTIISWKYETGDINFFGHLEQKIQLLNKDRNFINFDYSSLKNSSIQTPSNLDIIQITNQQNKIVQQKLF